MMARWWAFTVWAAVAASAVYWGLKLFVPAAPPPAHAAVAAPTVALRGDLTRLLGADPPPKVKEEADAPAESERFQLVGVVTPRGQGAGAQGVALIAVDGKPARAYKVGAVVDAGNVLQSVQARGAALGPRGGAALISLDLPAVPAAATGTLPPATGPAPVAGAPPKGAGQMPIVRPPMPMPGMPRLAPAPQLQTQQPGALAPQQDGNQDGAPTR